MASPPSAQGKKRAKSPRSSTPIFAAPNNSSSPDYQPDSTPNSSFLSDPASPNSSSNTTELDEGGEPDWREISGRISRQIGDQVGATIAANLESTVKEVISHTRRRMQSEMAKPGQAWTGNSLHTEDKKRQAGGQELPEKVFMHRESMLTDLLQISHIRAIYHMFATILILIAVETILTEYLDTGSFREHYHLEMCLWSFGQFSGLLFIWLLMQTCTLLVYPIFMFWVKHRPQKPHFLLLDLGMLLLYIFYLSWLMTVVGWLVLRWNLPPGSSFVIGVEMARFLMKTHAFVRSNAAKVYDKETVVGADTKKNPLSRQPTFGHFVYFLFAPTLVYRDAYPRTKEIRWSFVFSNGMQFLLCTFYTYFILFRFILVRFESVGPGILSVRQVLRLILGFMLPGGLILYIVFFCFLHSWLNMFAELLRFGDRLFYKDWWNSRSFATYYRTWNVVVHDWLYTYVYLDAYRITKSRGIGMIMVFTVSSYMHEYIICLTFKFFYPVLLILFGGAGFLLMFVKTRHRFWNLSFFANMCIGLGIEMALYANEWYSRKNCASHYPNDYWLDFFVPRSLYCNWLDGAHQTPR